MLGLPPPPVQGGRQPASALHRTLLHKVLITELNHSVEILKSSPVMELASVYRVSSQLEHLSQVDIAEPQLGDHPCGGVESEGLAHLLCL